MKYCIIDRNGTTWFKSDNYDEILAKFMSYDAAIRNANELIIIIGV